MRLRWFSVLDAASRVLSRELAEKCGCRIPSAHFGVARVQIEKEIQGAGD